MVSTSVTFTSPPGPSRPLLPHLLPPPEQHLLRVRLAPLLPGRAGPGAVSLQREGRLESGGQGEQPSRPRDLWGPLTWEASPGTPATRKAPGCGWLRLGERTLRRRGYCGNGSRKRWAGPSRQGPAPR